MIVGQAFANAPPSQTGLCRTRLREDDRKLIAAIPRWGVYRPVGETENIRQTLERPVSREMAAATALHPVHDREQSGALPFAVDRLPHARCQNPLDLTRFILLGLRRNTTSFESSRACPHIFGWLTRLCTICPRHSVAPRVSRLFNAVQVAKMCGFRYWAEAASPRCLSRLESFLHYLPLVFGPFFLPSGC
jgi:hypothetical protein